MNIKNYEIGNIGYKIALITDLHYEEDYDLNIFSNILNILKDNKPDFICLSGDIIDRNNLIKKEDLLIPLKQFIQDLGNITQTIVTIGNHELCNRHIKGDFNLVNDWFLKLNRIENIYYLYNKSLVRGNICFTSFDLPFEYYEIKSGKKSEQYLLKNIDKNINLTKKYYNILLSHSPIDIIKEKVLKESEEMKKVNLILSGHMHNGMVPPFLDGKGNIGIIGPYNMILPTTARNKIIKKIDDREITLIISGGVVKISSGHSKLLHSFNKLFGSHIVFLYI
jgi:hypothetical protein